MIFTLKKAITPFLLPPGLFVLILFALVGFFLFSKKYNSALTCVCIAIFIWIWSIVPVADFLVGHLENEYTVPLDPHGDVIILLGGATYSKADDFSGTGAPGPSSMERLVAAARLHHLLKIPIIVSGGKVFENSASAAEIARRFLVDLGIRPDKIIMENQSRDTFENASYTQEICRVKDFQSPLLVTSGYHLRRAMQAFRKVGFKVTPFPCGFTTWPDKTYEWNDFLPSAAALLTASIALHELIGIQYYEQAY